MNQEDPAVDDAVMPAPRRAVVTSYSRRMVCYRLAALGGLALPETMVAFPAKSEVTIDEWNAFKLDFLSSDGRIIDNGNDGVSHSEGQGWGMLFAAAANDQVSFELIRNWTARALRRPADALHAWRYIPKDGRVIADMNNAVDGDMFIAAALFRAGRMWGRPDYLRAASAIGHDILRLLVKRIGPFTVLLPGIEGFETTDGITINPSYYAFPMMTELARLVPSYQWDRLQNDGRTLIERGRFGKWSLPPDWLRIKRADASLSPAAGWPPRFSFDAVRIPLWWSWQGLPVGPAMQSIRQFWFAYPPGATPAWVDLETDELARFPATPGMTAIMRLMLMIDGSSGTSVTPTDPKDINYYDAALILLSSLAEQKLRSR